jgi:hypothetical protein
VAARTAPGASRIRRMAAASRGRVQMGPEATPPRNGAVLIASGHLDGIGERNEIGSRIELAHAMSRTLQGMTKTGPPRGKVPLASARWEYPPERRLGGDAERNWELMDAVTHPTALVASGGICAPVGVAYDVPTWATADRPLRDGLPAFQADRGGISYIPSPAFASLSAATTIWTEATDANPAGATNPVAQVVCGSPVTVYIDAVATRLSYGNATARFAPEQTAANTDMAMAYAARVAENNLLAHIQAAATLDVTTAILLGATRDLITAISHAAAALRSSNRIPQTIALTAVFPDWVKELIRVDLARQLATAASPGFNPMALSDDDIVALLRATGINPIFHIDGQAVNGSVYPAQTFTAQTASSAIETFPAKMTWYLWPEGAVQFLDGGRLDLGVISDSTLSATNDYEVMVEVWEALAFRGAAGQLVQFVSSLCANGASAGTISTVSACAWGQANSDRCVNCQSGAMRLAPEWTSV